MRRIDHAAHLRELTKSLVDVVEKRAGLKSKIAALKKARKTDSNAARQKALKRQIGGLTRRIEALIDEIGQPPRRMERWAGVIPVTLHVEARGRKYEHPASTLDMSDRGLRILTTTALVPGQTLDVYSSRALLGRCRVVWVAGAGASRPGEVGLEILC